MSEKKDILDGLKGRGDGTGVPDGYFGDFAARMAASLPYRQELDAPEREVTRRRSAWQQARPYVYMAAMFAGAWCLIKMFTLMGAGDETLSLDNNPVLRQAVADEHFVNTYVIGDANSYDIYDDLMEQGITARDLEAMFAQAADSAGTGDMDAADVAEMAGIEPDIEYLLPGGM